MRKLALLLVLLVCLPAVASSVIVIKKAAIGPSCALASKASVTLWNNYEGTDGDNYTISTDDGEFNVASATDNVWSDSDFGNAFTTVNANGAILGGSGIENNSGTSRGWFELDEAGGTIPDVQGRMFVSVRFDDMPSAKTTFVACDVANVGSNFSAMTDQDGDLYFRIGSIELNVVAGLTTGTNYHLEFEYDTNIGVLQDCLSIYVNGVLQNQTCSYNLGPVPCNSDLRLGGTLVGSGMDMDIDNLLITSAKGDDFYTHIVTNGCTDYRDW